MDALSTLKFAVEALGEDAFDFAMIVDDDSYVDLRGIHERLFADDGAAIEKVRFTRIFQILDNWIIILLFFDFMVVCSSMLLS